MEKKYTFPFTDLPSIPVLVKDFLNAQIPGFEGDLFSLKNFEQKINLKKQSFSEASRSILKSELLNQYQGFDLTEKQKTNINLISSENTFTVTTGHQLNLFSGPAFFFYKILQTIKTAEHLKQHFPENNFVPVFWMATEDHDFEEINHFKTEEQLFKIEEKSGGAAGRIIITDIVFVEEFAQSVKNEPFGEELSQIISECYQPGFTLMQATRKIVQLFFASYGLLAVDGDSAELKKQMIPTFKEEITSNSLKNYTKNRVEYLTDKYGKVQVNPREINLFHLSEIRDRIDKNEDEFTLNSSGKSFDLNEILSELENNPENFSPNALLRPVYQETVLPNIAYIGGNAEIMYWLELKDYFEHLNLPFPILIPRNSFLFLEPKTISKIEKSGVPIQYFLEGKEQPVNYIFKKPTALNDLLSGKKHETERIFNEIIAAASATDKTFGNLVEAEKARQIKSFQRMEKRLLKAEKIKHSELVERLWNLYFEVNPSGPWQERVYNFSVFYKNYGNAWLDACYKSLDVEKSGLIIMQN